MTVGESLREIRERLSKAGLEDAQMEAEFLVSAALKLSRPQLALEQTYRLGVDELTSLEAWTEARAARWPLAYILGNQPFGDMVLNVSPAVLIPRPETEAWVMTLMERLKTSPKALTIVDVGTGSGAVALQLAQSPRVKKIYGLDRSRAALAVARENAVLYDRAGTCEWVESDLLSGLPQEIKPDLVVANLPYIAERVLSTLAPEVQREPRQALEGGPIGDEMIFRLLDQVEARWDHALGLWLEIGFDQATRVAERFRRGVWNRIQVEHDHAALPRVVRAVQGEPIWMS